MPKPHFNSHARVGRDGFACAVKAQHEHFNSHARVGRDANTGFDLTHLQDFNSHARVGRDYDQCFYTYLNRISTHTPV